MTFKQIIDYVDTVRPNPYDDDTKLTWLCEAEGIVRSEVLSQGMEYIPQSLDGEDEPSAPMPYVRLYSYYIFSMMDFLTSDYDSYKISSEMFEKAIEIYAKWHIRGGDT